MNLASLPIPDKPLFDDGLVRADVRLWQVLRQAAPVHESGGREILWWCSCCQKIWYQQGRRQFPQESQQQVAALAERLHADVGVVSCLPEMICPVCAIDIYRGVPLVIEELESGGYRLVWYDAEADALLLCALAPPYGKHTFSEQIDALLRRRGDPPTLLAPLERLLVWLPRMPRVKRSSIFPLSSDLCLHLSGILPPPPSCQWSGYSWRLPSSSFGSPLLVVMALTGVEKESPELLRTCWRLLGPLLLEVIS